MHSGIHMYMKVQKGKTNPNLGEAIPVPSQAHLPVYIYNTSAKSRATYRCLALRTRTGRFKSSFVPRVVHDI